jgi:mono/diheme cytochrome c family protein
MCHGAKGDGKGDLVPRLGLKMPDLSDPKLQAKRTDGEWFYIITQGHGQMPGEGDRLAATRKWQLINLMRTLAPPPRTTP